MIVFSVILHFSTLFHFHHLLLIFSCILADLNEGTAKNRRYERMWIYLFIYTNLRISAQSASSASLFPLKATSGGDRKLLTE